MVDDRHRFCALRLSDPGELALLEAVSRGEFFTTGFRNRDLRRLLYARPQTKADDRKRSGRLSRLLRLLRVSSTPSAHFPKTFGHSRLGRVECFFENDYPTVRAEVVEARVE
ncbi:MAG: hypothetical protein HY270_11580 [Deltaproteobacteria bacterium]|nr:hypothetical protein [Deltaproteobacteria bacterium]